MNDMHALRKRLRAQGFTVTLTRKGHWRVEKDGVRVTTLGPRSRASGIRNGLARLKRAGYRA